MDSNGCFIEKTLIHGDKKPLDFEYVELKRALSDFVNNYYGERQGGNTGWLAKIRKTSNNYNIYGRIITKKKKGCSYFYKLLNAQHW